MIGSVYFSSYELVPKSVWDRYGTKSYRFIDERLLCLIDLIRSETNSWAGSATCNDWYWGGANDSRGFRPPDDSDGAKLSAHKRGCAVDLVFSKCSAEDMREWITENIKYIRLKTGIRSISMELGVNWLHIAVENLDDGLNVFNP